MTNPEIIGCLGVIAIAGCSIFRWCRREIPLSPDPWGPEIDRIVRDPETPALCPRCLTPQTSSAWFCPECGSAVGPYNNYMPFVNIFSEGEVLRSGVTDHVRPSIPIVLGYLLLSLGTYYVFAPLYWFQLFRNLKRQHNQSPESGPKV
jgi:hypothetical protein